MKYLYLVCRILLGLLFIVFGANILHPFLPQPAMSGKPLDFMMVMGPSGWMHHVGFFQVLGGLLILLGGTVPLGLCILCPITFNILLFHILLLGGQGIGPGIGAAAMELALIYGYRQHFAGILTVRATPTF